VNSGPGPVGKTHVPPGDTGANLEWFDDSQVRASLTSLIASEKTCEVCAMLVALPDGLRLIRLRSVNRSPTTFAIPECEWRRVDRLISDHGGKALCLVHSHPGGGAFVRPSETDLQNTGRTPDLPWVIVTRDRDAIAYTWV
jgi:proteasome lid subunit RPN8/RPN11